MWAYLPVGQLCMLRRGAAVVTFELVFGLLQELVQAVLKAGSVAPLSCLLTSQLLKALRQQSLLHVGVPATVHLFRDLRGGIQ